MVYTIQSVRGMHPPVCRNHRCQPIKNNCTCRCRHVHEQLTHAVQEAVHEQMGSECLLLIMDALQEAGVRVVGQVKEEELQAHAAQQPKHSSKRSQIGRRAIWYDFNSSQSM